MYCKSIIIITFYSFQEKHLIDPYPSLSWQIWFYQVYFQHLIHFFCFRNYVKTKSLSWGLVRRLSFLVCEMSKNDVIKLDFCLWQLELCRSNNFKFQVFRKKVIVFSLVEVWREWGRNPPFSRPLNDPYTLKKAASIA